MWFWHWIILHYIRQITPDNAYYYITWLKTLVSPDICIIREPGCQMSMYTILTMFDVLMEFLSLLNETGYKGTDPHCVTSLHQRRGTEYMQVRHYARRTFRRSRCPAIFYQIHSWIWHRKKLSFNYTPRNVLSNSIFSLGRVVSCPKLLSFLLRDPRSTSSKY